MGFAHSRTPSDGGDHSQEGYLIGSALGFLALLMAFSFSMALGRYEERRHLVVQEANAIGTAYLRAQLLDEPHRSRLSGLLFQYTDNRIALGTGNHSGLDGQIALNDRLLTDIWAAVTAARDSAAAHGISTPLLTSYNEVIDLDTERKMARQVRLPAPLTLMLFGFLLDHGGGPWLCSRRTAREARRLRPVLPARPLRRNNRRSQPARGGVRSGIAGTDACAPGVAAGAAAAIVRQVRRKGCRCALTATDWPSGRS